MPCLCLQENGEVDADFALLDPRDIITKDLDELRMLALEKKEKQAEKSAGAQQQRMCRRGVSQHAVWRDARKATCSLPSPASSAQVQECKTTAMKAAPTPVYNMVLYAVG